MRRIKCVQYPFVQPPDDTVISGGVETITCDADGVQFIHASGDEEYLDKYKDQHPQTFIRGQNYWFIKISDYWVEKWDLDNVSAGRQVDKLLLAGFVEILRV